MVPRGTDAYYVPDALYGMAIDHEQSVREAFPELTEIADDALRGRVVDALSLALADVLERRFDVTVDRDVVVAGALLHDVSKLYETTGDETTVLQSLVPHPHYAVHVIARSGIGTDVQHVTLAHTNLSDVEPDTMEARIVQSADQIALDGLFWEHRGVWPRTPVQGRRTDG